MMLVMESASRYNRPSLPPLRYKQSVYEPSDTGTEWQESPRHEGLLPMNKPKAPDPVRTISPLRSSQRQTSKEDYDNTSVKASRTHPITRSHSMCPYKPIRDGDDTVSSQTCSDLRRNASAFEASEHQKHGSPYKARREEPTHENNGFDGSFQNHNQKTPPKFLNSVDKRAHSQLQEVARVSERFNYSRNRSMSAPKPRAREKQQQISSGPAVRGPGRCPLPLAQTMIHKGSDGAYARNPSRNEINEIIAITKLSKSSSSDALLMQSTESIAPGDIFFSRDCTDLQKKSEMKNNNHENNFAPPFNVIPEKNNDVQQLSRWNGSFNQIPQAPSISIGLSRTNTSSSSAVSRSSSGRTSNDSAKLSDSSGKLGDSFRNFAANRQRGQTDAWFSCVKGGSCRKPKLPESRAINEASLIEKAFVVEELRLFWADKHRPRSLSGFICRKQQTQHLKQLISQHNCPHILFKGPSGSGKKSLCRALLHDIFGDSSWKISYDLRHFHVQETTPVQIVVPLTSSPHHVELNLKTESKKASYALMALVKEIAGNHALTPERDTSFKADYKVIVLYDVDKVEESVQHLIKWIMGCYTDACKIILCCEDDTDLLDSIKSCCKLVTIDAPVTHEIMEVLLQIAKKENFELSVSFAARIATKSKQNMRRAIMALEACKAHNYPFVDDQPIPLGWEEVLVELASEILADPSPKRCQKIIRFSLPL